MLQSWSLPRRRNLRNSHGEREIRPRLGIASNWAADKFAIVPLPSELPHHIGHKLQWHREANTRQIEVPSASQRKASYSGNGRLLLGKAFVSQSKGECCQLSRPEEPSSHDTRRLPPSIIEGNRLIFNTFNIMEMVVRLMFHSLHLKVFDDSLPGDQELPKRYLYAQLLHLHQESSVHRIFR